MNPARAWLLVSGAVFASVLLALAQQVPSSATRIGTVKGLSFPEYYPATNGVRRLKTLVTGTEARMLSNSVIALKNPAITNYTYEGRVEWMALAPEATLNLNTREVFGNSNIVLRTADERLFLRGVGFLYQQNHGMFILSNEVFTWIDRRAITNKNWIRP